MVVEYFANIVAVLISNSRRGIGRLGPLRALEQRGSAHAGERHVQVRERAAQTATPVVCTETRQLT
ncbi:hypothetical protein D3C86_2152850 [compost metagenome]